MDLPLDPYMRKTELLLKQGRARLDWLAPPMRAATPAFSAIARRKRLMQFEALYADVLRRYTALRSAGTEGIADLKVALEKSWAAFEAQIGSGSLPRPGLLE